MVFVLVDFRYLLLIVYNFGMYEIVLMLMVGGDFVGVREFVDNLFMFGFVIFDFDVEDWGDVFYCCGKLVLFISLKLL